MTEVRVSTPVTPADMDAAFQFVVKRVRRHGNEPLDGMLAALYSVMYQVGDALMECGLPASQLLSMVEQMKPQVVAALMIAKRPS